MRRFTILLAILAVVLFGFPVAPGDHARAQDVTPATVAAHPVVGAWRWNLDPADPEDDSYGVFHADGTYVEVAHNGVGVGVWQPTGERTADLTIVFQDIDIDPNVFAPGTSTIRQVVTVDETGNALSGPFTVEARAPDGTLVFEGEFAGAATRMEVEPMVPLGTPVASAPSASRPSLAHMPRGAGLLPDRAFSCDDVETVLATMAAG